jgi:predicted PurR-regulated permease PerM
LTFGAYFLREYFILIVVAADSAYLFNPLFNRLQKRFSKGISVTLTLLSALCAMIIPFGLLVLLATVQISAMVRSVSAWVSRTDLSSLGDKALALVNGLLDKVSFLHGVDVTMDTLRERMTTFTQHAGEYALGFLQNAAGGVAGAVTAAVLFGYVFISLLSNREQVQMLIRKLNPLGEEVTDLYLDKMGAMVRATVLGQFVIALAPDRRHQHRQRPSPRLGAAGCPAGLRSHAAGRLRGHHHVRVPGDRHRPRADDRHRDDGQRLPLGVQGRSARRPRR